MKKFIILLLIFAWCGLIGAAPNRQNIYVDGEIIEASDVTENEDAIFDYLSDGVDTYTAGSIDISTDTNLSASSGVTLTGDALSATLGTSIDISSETNLTAGDNITLTGDDLDVDDAFLVNDADDTMVGALTTTGSVSAESVYVTNNVSGITVYASNTISGVVGDFQYLEYSTGGSITFRDAIASAYNITSTATIEAATLTEGGNAIYNAADTPGGSLGGTWSNPTIDDLFVKNDASDAMTGVLTSQGVLPDGDNTRDLGSTSASFANIYSDSTVSGVVVDAQNFEYSSGGAVTIRDDLTVNGNIVETTPSSFNAVLAFPDALQTEIDNWQLKAIEAEEFPDGITVTKLWLYTSASSTYSLDVEIWSDPDSVSSQIGTVATSGSIEANTPVSVNVSAGEIIQLDLDTDDLAWIAVKVDYVKQPN